MRITGVRITGMRITGVRITGVGMTGMRMTEKTKYALAAEDPNTERGESDDRNAQFPRRVKEPIVLVVGTPRRVLDLESVDVCDWPRGWLALVWIYDCGRE
jgi:hypothetical protein